MVGFVGVFRRGAVVATTLQRAGVEPTASLRLETLRDPREIERLAPEWRAMMAATSHKATIYQSFDWAVACAARLKPGTQLCVLAAREHGRLVAVAPFIIDRWMGLSTLRWLGGNLAIYGDVLAEPSVDVSNWLSRALGELAERGEVQSLQLDNVRADARIAPFLASQGREMGGSSAPWIDLAARGTFEAWRARQSRTTRRSRSRRLKQLEAVGTVSFVFEPAGSCAAGRIAQLFAMKRDWASRRKVISRTIWDRDFEDIVGRLVSGDSRLDVRFSILMLDGKAIAIELGFVSHGVYASYLGAYDPAFETYSSGILQLERTIEACFAEGIQIFDLQPPADAYKQSLACEEMAVSSFSIALSRIGFIQTVVAQANPVGFAKLAINLMPASCRHAAYSVASVLRGPQAKAAVRALRTAGSSKLKRALLLLGAGGAVAAVMAD